MEKQIGIYCIENIVNWKKYIGQSTNISDRLGKHKNLLKNERHYNTHLQNSYNKYGINNFIFYIIEECDVDMLDDKERYYIQLYHTCDDDYGYNIESGGSNCKKLSDETKEKLRLINQGKTMSEETKKKISESNKGRIISDEQKKFLSDLHKGLRHSQETKIKIGIASKKENLSEETLIKMRESHKKENLSAETLTKMHESHSRYVVSDETKEKLRLAFQGREFSDEWKKKISDAVKIPIYCPQLDEFFPSAKDAEEKYKSCGVNRTKISSCIHNERKSSGKHPITGEPLTWVKILKE